MNIIGFLVFKSWRCPPLHHAHTKRLKQNKQTENYLSLKQQSVNVMQSNDLSVFTEELWKAYW